MRWAEAVRSRRSQQFWYISLSLRSLCLSMCVHQFCIPLFPFLQQSVSQFRSSKNATNDGGHCYYGLILWTASRWDSCFLFWLLILCACVCVSVHFEPRKQNWSRNMRVVKWVSACGTLVQSWTIHNVISSFDPRCQETIRNSSRTSWY